MLDQPPIKLQARTIVPDTEYWGVRCSFSDRPLQGLVFNFHRNHGSNTTLIKGGGWEDIAFPKGCYVGLPQIAELYLGELTSGKWPQFTWYEA
jgi:hypothetical protein